MRQAPINSDSFLARAPRTKTRASPGAPSSTRATCRGAAREATALETAAARNPGTALRAGVIEAADHAVGPSPKAASASMQASPAEWRARLELSRSFLAG